MKILYISPSPPPPIRDTDGLINEIGYLQKKTGGDILYLSPFRFIPSFTPVRILGLQNIPMLKKYEKKVDLVHIFFPYFVNFYYLRLFRKPLIYTITSGIDGKSSVNSLSQSNIIVVSSDHERAYLYSMGFNNVNVVRPGIDLSEIQVSQIPENKAEFVILAGSSPWTNNQFGSKGFDLLLQVLARMPYIRLVCLWRGALYEEWYNRILSSGLIDRVEIINERADVSRVLSRCHAAVVLAARADLVKSYPNSLMEALAAGKPVLISRVIPMSYYVEENGCGTVVETLTVDDLINAIREIKDRYSVFKSAADLVGRRDFSRDRMVEEYCGIYNMLTK
jgi:glycosyltransferase involved in cell wall biosynthesis